MGNVVRQSAKTQNPVVISYGAEGNVWPDNALFLSHNTLISDYAKGAWFLRIPQDKFPSPPKVLAINNLTVGLGVFALGSIGQFDGNYPALPSMLANPDMMDFTLSGNSPLRDLGVTPGRFASKEDRLAPTAEFSLPIGTRRLDPPQKWTPGAFQTMQQ